MTTTETAPTSERVLLKSGRSVSLAALRVLWDLEDRAFDLRLTAESTIRVRPAAALTAADRAAILVHRDELRVLIAYCTEVVA